MILGHFEGPFSILWTFLGLLGDPGRKFARFFEIFGFFSNLGFFLFFQIFGLWYFGFTSEFF